MYLKPQFTDNSSRNFVTAFYFEKTTITELYRMAPYKKLYDVY